VTDVTHRRRQGGYHSIAMLGWKSRSFANRVIQVYEGVMARGGDQWSPGLTFHMMKLLAANGRTGTMPIGLSRWARRYVTGPRRHVLATTS